MPLECNGFTAHICCDGKELEAYGLQKEDGQLVSCWIASETGNDFTVHWGDVSASATLQVIIKMDGRIVARHAHRTRVSGKSGGVEETPGEEQPYQFVPLVMTDLDDDDVASSKAVVADNLGLIEVTIRTMDHYVEKEQYYSVGQISRIGLLHEKSKKAGVHAVSPGLSRGLNEEPVAIFRFHYRPLALLQANGVVRLPPKPQGGKKRPSAAQNSTAAGPSSLKRQRPDNTNDDGYKSEDDDALNRVKSLQDQIVSLQDQLAREQAKLELRNAVKRELSPIHIPDGDNEIIDLTVEREISPIVARCSGDHEIIDLT